MLPGAGVVEHVTHQDHIHVGIRQRDHGDIKLLVAGPGGVGGTDLIQRVQIKPAPVLGAAARQSKLPDRAGEREVPAADVDTLQDLVCACASMPGKKAIDRVGKQRHSGAMGERLVGIDECLLGKVAFGTC